VSPVSSSLPRLKRESRLISFQLSRKFWRHMLPRLKFHNPAVEMTVTRSSDQTGPATLAIYMRRVAASAAAQSAEESASSSEQAPELLPSESFPQGPNRVDQLLIPTKSKIPRPSKEQEVVTIDMKNKQENEILREFLKVTGGQEVQPTQGELDTLRELEEFREKSKSDSERSKAVRAAWKREQDMLKQARGELAE
jgi:large subunit ribosomal protein MRP49